MPENVIFLFPSPYCPDLNPIERVWQYLKRQIKTLRKILFILGLVGNIF
ncbi:MAG: hypothetical protein BRC37_11895 [Cyanobacteria bacterium QH_3_48_40]|nr:MAG: hypothetical protein BRC37_11895 [Cyanobacteria bacterium QH_3_48_40]